MTIRKVITVAANSACVPSSSFKSECEQCSPNVCPPRCLGLCICPWPFPARVFSMLTGLFRPFLSYLGTLFGLFGFLSLLFLMISSLLFYLPLFSDQGSLPSSFPLQLPPQFLIFDLPLLTSESSYVVRALPANFPDCVHTSFSVNLSQ